MKDPNRFLCIARNLPEIILPVKATTRVKYLCIAVSNNYICVGASTGSTYIFGRNTGKLIKFISNKVSGIINLKFSNNGKILAAADSAGLVTCWEVDELSHNFKIVKEIDDFNNHSVTAICWSETRIFIGDQNGQVMSFSMGFSKASLKMSSVDCILKSGDPVVQMDFCNGKLLISTKTRSVLCVEEKSIFSQIGTKPRDGLYGSCFLKDASNVNPVIYSARPGSRLWEVDYEGQVLATHQFKELLAVAPSLIVTIVDTQLPESNLSWSKPQAFNFPYLYPVMGRYLLTWSPGGIYIFEPKVGNVAAWNDQIKDIVNISSTGYDMYFLHSNGSVTEVCLYTTKECLLAFRKTEDWKKLLEFACDHQDEIFEDVESFLTMGFHDILGKYKECEAAEENLVLKTEDFIQKLEQYHAEVRAKVEERLNAMWTLTDTAVLPEYGQNLNDTDDIKSDISGGSGGSSSRMSLSMMSEISLNSFWQKATNMVVSKVITTGLMKKSFQSALEEEGVYLDYGRNFVPPKMEVNNVEQKEIHSAPNSPKLIRTDLYRSTSTKSLDTNDVKNVGDLEPMSPNKAQSFSCITQDDTGKVVERKEKLPVTRLGGKKIRKKKKVKVIDIDSPGIQPAAVTNGFKCDIDTGKTMNIAANSVPEIHSLSLDESDKIHKGNHTTIKSVNGDVASHSPSKLKLESNEDLNPPESMKITNSMEKHGDILAQSVSPDVSEWHLPLPSSASSLVNKLLNTTAATRNGIRDPGVLYNSKAIHDLLQRWGNQLAKTEKEFRNECFNNLRRSVQENMNATFLSGFEYECRKSLFNQISSAFGEISNAAMLCFETNIFPKNCSSLKNHEIRLLNLDLTLNDIYKNFKEQRNLLNELPDIIEPSVHLTNGCSDIGENEPIDNGLSTDKQSSDLLQIKHETLKQVPSNESFTSSFDYCDMPTEEEFENSVIEDVVVDDKVREVLPDQVSLNTILSKSDYDISDIDLIFDVVSDELNEKSFLCENFNINDGEICHSCIIDQCRACFVLRYFPLLNFTRMRSLLLWNGGCRWKTWLACMLHLKELHKNSKVNHLLENGNISLLSKELEHQDVEIFLGCATRLYEISPELVMDYVYNGQLTAYEITLLFQTGYLQNSCVTNFLQYAVDQTTSSRIDSLFATNALHSALLCQPNKVEIFCTCGKATPGSNTIQWKWQDLLLKLIENIKIHYAPDLDKEMVLKFSQFCANNGFWLGYIQLLSIIGDSKTIMECVYQLGDHDLLKELISKGSIHPSDDLWTLLLDKICEDMDNQDNDHSCKPIDGWTSSLTLEKLLRMVAIHSGSKFTLAMIHKFRNHNVLSPDIYLSLVMAAELENKQESLVTRLIEVASGKVWSEKKNILHPQFEVIKDADLTGYEATPILPSSFKSNDYIMEESDTVWGRSINISSAECPVCTLPLCLKTMSSSTAGLIVLQCGHSFHKVCLPESACLVCFHDNFTSLY